MNSHLGRFAIVTVAKINNAEELAAKLLARGMHFSEFSSGRINPTELVALLINQGQTFVEGIENVYKEIKGSCSLLLLTEDGIVAARDSWGRTPVVVGRKEGAYAVTGETTAFPNLGYETSYYLGPGEIVRLRSNGMESLRKPNKKNANLLFPVGVLRLPDVLLRGTQCGGSALCLRQEDGRGRRDGGGHRLRHTRLRVGMALGYAVGKGVPYQRAISKYTPTWPRSFTPSNQEMRSLVAKMKLIANRDMLNGKRVLFCDDSIVRGTQLRDNTKVLFDYGAKEVHMRIACPPLIYGCPFINFTASKSDMELITRQFIKEFEGDENRNLEKYAETGSPEYCRMVDAIAERLNLSSLKFNTLEDLVAAIGLPKCQVCTHCFDGSSRFSLDEENTND